MTKGEHGFIFNIQKYCVHDGPGIRSIVFFKGCPLACKWCANPEGIEMKPEISYKLQSCIDINRCGYCIKACSHQAIQIGNSFPVINRDKCMKCYECTEICPSQAIERIGKYMTVEEVLKEVTKDEAFFSRSEGGITLSGGEPLVQSDFVLALIDEAKKEGVEIAIETTGCVPWEKAERIFERLDFIHYDLKSLNNEKHKAFTGRGNALILANFKRLCTMFPNKRVIVRTPIIPGFNDTVEDVQAIVDFLHDTTKQMKHIQYELLPFHNFGSAKYECLGKAYSFEGFKNMDKQVVEDIKSQLKSHIELI